MATTIDWGNLVIQVPRNDMPIVQAFPPFEVRQLDVNQFRLDLKALEASEDGMPFPATHEHATERTLSGISYARFVELINGYTVEFEDGQYGVVLIGANNNIVDVKVPNQVSIISNNSAGLVNNESINAQSFLEGRVYIDTIDGMTGTTYPKGTPFDPVNNYDDAYAIATFRKLHSYFLQSPNLLLTIGQDILRTSWKGDSADTSRLILVGEDTTGCVFESMVLIGTLNGRITTRYCGLSNVVNFSGSARNTGLSGIITIDSAATELINFIECYSAAPGIIRPEVNTNNANCNFQFRGYYGGLKITNFTQGNNMSIDGDSAVIEIDSTCTAGTIVIGGVVEIIDNSGPGCTVVISRTVQELVWNKEICP